MISYQSTDGATLVAYLAWPSDASGDRSHPAVVVCHENRGLNDHIMDVARRYAKQGYVAIAPDLPSRFGVPTSQLSPDEVMAAYRQMDAAQNAWDFKAAGDWVRSHPAVDPSKSAATGFCFGGGVIWRLTEVDDQLTAAAPFYGSSPPLEAVPQIKAAVLGVYASDDRITDSRGPLEEALDAAGVRHQTNIYPGTNHAFHNDTGAAYNQEQAVAAYKDALNWFAQYLGLPAPTV
jgi:carboxymethylenebutenolidase